jgi:hypothetical protein
MVACIVAGALGRAVDGTWSRAGPPELVAAGPPGEGGAVGSVLAVSGPETIAGGRIGCAAWAAGEEMAGWGPMTLGNWVVANIQGQN